MVINRSYKYCIKPNSKQIEAINVIFNNCDFVKKLYLEDIVTKAMPKKLKEVLDDYKEKYPYLKKTDTLALMNVLFKTHDEFERGKIDSIPRMKKSYTTAFFKYADCFKLYDYQHIYLPKVGNVKIVIHRPFPKEGKLITATVMKEPDGKYFVAIDFEIEKKAAVISLDVNKSIGLDYSSTHFIVDSNGLKYEMPHFYRNNIDTLIKMRKQLDKCVKNSENYYKQKKEIIRLHQKIARARKHWLHVTSTKLTNEYDYICIEDINLQALVKKSKLHTATKDNSYGEFVKMLKYKAEDKGKKLIKISRWYPSTKTCHVCGNVENIEIGVKQWECSKCHSILDRDVNAAINIRNEGMKSYTAD